MQSVRIMLLWLVLAAFVAGIVGCNTLAMGGEKKYKVDLSNMLLKIKDQIESDGEVSDNTQQRFAALLAKYEEEYSNRSSHRQAMAALEAIQKAKEEPGDAFNHYQNAQMCIVNVQDALKTEIKN